MPDGTIESEKGVIAMVNKAWSICLFFLLILVALPIYSEKDPFSREDPILGDYPAYWTAGANDTSCGPPVPTECPAWQDTAITIDNNGRLWIGADNVHIWERYKVCSLKVWGSDVLKLELENALGHIDSTNTWIQGIGLVKDTLQPDTVLFLVTFTVQPDHEVFRVKAIADNVTITGGRALSSCWLRPKMPSLTIYGIVILAILILASAIYIISRRRKGVTPA
jgi:hypothetical protein